MRPVANHARREVGNCVEAALLERARQLHGRLEPLGRGGRDGHGRAGRQEPGLVVDVLQRDQLVRDVAERGDQPGPRRTLGQRRRSPIAAPQE